MVGQAVQQCITQHKVLKDLTLEEFRAMSPLFDSDIYDAIDIETCVRNRASYGGTSPEQVARQQQHAAEAIAFMKKQAADWKAVSAFLE